MRFSLLILTAILLFFSCRKKDYGSVKLIGHAGSGLSITTSPFHDNSLKSIQYALETEGIAGVEVDVQCSANGTAWLFHDPELDNQTNGSGCPNSVTDDYLQSLHYTTAEQEPLSMLKELAFPFGSKELFLDLRSSNACKSELIDVHVVINAIQQAFPGIPPAQIIVITNQPQWIPALSQLGWKVFHEVEAVNMYLSGTWFPQTAGVCMRNSTISSEETANVQSQGKQVFLFDVRSPKSIRNALKKYPDYLLTDDLKAALIEKY